MRINQRGFWENETAEGHGHDEGLAKAIVEFLEQEKEALGEERLVVYDFGCGDGWYTNYFNQHRGIICLGYDGNPYTEELTDYDCDILDLSVPHHLIRSDWVLSLEVGEHIPEEYETIFIENLVNNARRGVILSWAVPGQGGDGHVNCRPNKYIIERMGEYGFYVDVDSSIELREAAAQYPNTGYWFRDTMMVFRKEKSRW